MANESPIKTFADLMALAKTRPVNVGSYSAGYQLAMEWVSVLNKTRFTYLPYKGQVQVLTDVIGRQLDAGLGDLGRALPLIQNGRMSAIAISGFGPVEMGRYQLEERNRFKAIADSAGMRPERRALALNSPDAARSIGCRAFRADRSGEGIAHQHLVPGVHFGEIPG